MIVYNTDEYGNLNKKVCQTDIKGRPIYDDRQWSPTPAPEVKADEIAVCLNGKWEVKKKNLGKWYHKESAEEREITEYDPYFKPEDYTALVPCEYPKWDGKAWIIDTERKTAEEEAIKLGELYDIDRQSIRPLRAVLSAMQAGKTPPAEDVAKLAELEISAKEKRNK